MHKLWHYLKRFWRNLTVGPAFKLTEAVFELMVPLVMKDIIDIGIAGGNTSYIYQRGALMVALGVFGLLFAVICQYCAARAAQGVGTDMRRDLFAHIGTLSQKEIGQIGAPSLITRITNDINQIQTGVAILIRLAVRVPFLIIGSTIMAMRINLKVSLIFIIAAPLIVALVYLVMRKAMPFYRRIQEQLDRLTLVSRENLAGVRVIRAFSRQQDEQERFDSCNDTLRDTSLRVGRISALLSPLSYTIINFAIVGIIWYGGNEVYAGNLLRGDVYALVSYMTQNLLALIIAVNIITVFAKTITSSTRVQEVFDLQPAIQDDGNPQAIPRPGAPKIEFRDVCFSYEGTDEYSLSGLALSVMPGETIGIIGGTGSGKSTLVQLIPRFFDSTKGEVLVDGVNVRDYPLLQLRRQIGIVPQKATLFSGSIRYNLSWRDQQADDAELMRALEIAQAAQFVSQLAQGLDTEIHQAGKNLSGGQRQRLAIARALVGSPQILILDDSASALDFATDAALRKAIRQDTADMTVLIVSQRVNTVRDADRIVVLDDGAVAGIGTHAQLLKSCGTYREICLSQLSKEEVPQ